MSMQTGLATSMTTAQSLAIFMLQLEEPSAGRQGSSHLSPFQVEAEYMAAAAAAKEATWLKVLFSEIKLSLMRTAVKLFIDNQSAMSLMKNATFHDWMKHIEIRHHYIREKVDEGEIVLEYLLTVEQVADILTKPLSREKHICFIEGMGLII